MFRPIIIISSLLITLYFHVKFVTKSIIIEANSELYISPAISLFCKTPILHMLFALTLLILPCALIFKGRYIRYLSYIISLMVLNMAWYVTMDMLALKNMTTYFLIKIYHPIPLEVKINYLAHYINFLYENAKLPLDAKYTLENILCNSSIKSMLPLMDAEAIQKYSRDVIYATGYEYNTTPNFPGLATFMGALVLTCVIDFSFQLSISLVTTVSDYFKT